MGEQRIDKLHDLPLLLDVYGCLLTDKQRQALSLTYEEDYSLAEIAALHGGTRQAVFSLIERGEALLRDYESRLHLLQREAERVELLHRLSQVLADIPMEAEERRATEELLCRL